MKAYGADGCRSGWFYFELQGDRYDYGVVSNLAELVEKASPGDRILVDIPIGLRDSDSTSRLCDQRARRLLGQPRRLHLLSRVWEPSEQALGEAFLWFGGTGVARDDVVDALVAAVTAAQPDEHLFTIPEDPEIDSKGLPMEMVYALFD